MPRKPRNPGSGKAPQNGPASGEGWGGPARNGESASAAGKAGPGRPEGLATGQGKQALARAAMEDAAPMAVQTVINIARDTTDQRALAAAVAILNRVGLHEKSGVEHTGADGGAVAIEWRIVNAGDPDAEGV
jgi:hypothetical protein